MPFDRYLQPRESSQREHSEYPNGEENTQPNMFGDSSAFAGSVQFQIPQFMLGGPPTLAHGGGAEVLPVGMMGARGSLASSWFHNNGFYLDQESSLASTSSTSYNNSSQDAHTSHKLLAASFSSYSSLLPQSMSDSSSSNTPFSLSPIRSQATTSSLDSTSTPFDTRIPLSSNYTMNFLNPTLPALPISAPSSLGLPLYSASGFDLLSLLARLAARPNPKIILGPVDMTCSFTVVDVRRYDTPIVYASPSFYSLTGYQEHEVIGKNCRFLQSPDGLVQKGETRRFTYPEAVGHLRKNLIANKECQTSIVNYRKDGQAFINLVTVIPIMGGVNNDSEEQDEVVYQIGFQVDLTHQPNAILQKVRDGSYVVNYSSGAIVPPPAGASGRRVATHALSKDLRTLLADPSFIDSLPLTSIANAAPIPATSNDKAESDGVHPLNLLLLESTPDFIHVLSLKGSFLYVAPSVRRVLGYEAEELVGKSIAQYCHPADVVPLMRELKESSTTHSGSVDGLSTPMSAPRTVDLLFRAQSKWNGYVWVECRGRLHVEPGKGRKAIILSGRVRSLPRLCWSSISRAGGLVPSVPTPPSCKDDEDRDAPVQEDREFWGMLSTSGTFLVVGAGVRDLLGWSVGELIGTTIGNLLVSGDGTQNDEMKRIVGDAVVRVSHNSNSDPLTISCHMRRKDCGQLRVSLVMYHSEKVADPPSWPLSSSSCPVVCQVKREDPTTRLTTSRATSIVHPPNENVFLELTTARGSSWQYELQQLKFANRRILEELERESHAPAPTPDFSIPQGDPSRVASHSTTQTWNPFMHHSSHSLYSSNT